MYNTIAAGSANPRQATAATTYSYYNRLAEDEASLSVSAFRELKAQVKPVPVSKLWFTSKLL